MIFPRHYIALDVRHGELRAVTVKRRQNGSFVKEARLMALPSGVINPSSHSKNIVDRDRFRMAIEEVLNPVTAGEERIALILPETVGRVMTVDMESPIVSKIEGEKILKWKLKGNLPAEPDSVHLDFQLLGQREEGRKHLLVAAIEKTILAEYESIIRDAGYFPVLVGFHSLFLHNYYRTRLDQPEESVLIVVESGCLSFEYSQSRTPVYHRFKVVGDDYSSIFQEISRTLVGAQESYPGLKRAAVFLQTDLSDTETILDISRAAFQREVILLDPHIDRMTTQTSDWPAWRLRGLTAAIGAAEQLITGV